MIENYLFFNHTYLRQLQADSSIDEQAAAMAQGVHGWYGYRDTASTQTLVDTWIMPMLQILELELQPLALAPPPLGSAAPYLIHTAFNAQTPVGLCYVTPPGANLDSTAKGSHWMAHAVLAARRWQSASEGDEDEPEPAIHNSSLRWVILTNGDQWRLLDAQALRRYEAYLQVDLGEMARDQSDLTALRVFYRCFHRTAFAPDGDNEVGLDHLLTESNRATERAERHLKQKMEGVLGNLCRGFVAADGKTTYSEAERDTIFADATYLLYRILFIFYAESRGLLPVERAEYRNVGMQALAEQARRYKSEGMPDLQATSLWDQLKRLGDAIYGAEHEPENELGIPAYNGDLFNNADHPYLAGAAITDQYLTDALVDLAFLPEGQTYRPLDYRDLSVRHLGSLYEGMLEYKLYVAEQPMLARRDDKGNVTYLVRDEGITPIKTDQWIKPGEVYFSQSLGERKATGSYYTPEYVVDYIVQQTVWTGLNERRQPLDKKLAWWQSELAGAVDEAERSRWQSTIDRELLDFVEQQVLTFRVCDPAMGSGHFLVNATLTIANFIVETLNLGGWLNADLNCSPALWRRHLVERCIYGVDLNPLAVELAKLSLWLVTMTYGKPLSFLNHHLRCGNSLIGTRFEELADVLAGIVTRSSRRVQKEQAAGQLLLDYPAFDQHLTTATTLLKRISTHVADTVADVKNQEGDYEQVRAELAPYHQLADILVARKLGLIIDDRQLREMTKHLTKDAFIALPAWQRTMKEVQAHKDKSAFFHWELEFPEIFLVNIGQNKPKERGFDAVIGNPPYLNAWLMTEKMPIERSAIKNLLDDTGVLEGHWDLYIPFIIQSIRIARSVGAHHSFIVPNLVLREKYGLSLRLYLLDQHFLKSILSFGETNVFDEVSRQCIIYAIRTGVVSSRKQSIRLATEIDPLLRYKTIAEIDNSVWLAAYNYQIRIDKDYVSKLPVLEKVEKCSDLLGQYLYVNVGATVSSKEPGKFSKKDVVTKNPVGNARKFFEGSDLSKWSLEWQHMWLDYRRDEMSGPRTPEMFETEKLLVRIRTAENERLIATYDNTEMYCDHTVIVCCDYDALVGTNARTEFEGFERSGISLSKFYVLSLLNSSLMTWVFKNKYATGGLQGSFSDVWPQSVRAFPIRHIEFTTPPNIRGSLVENGQEAFKNYLCNGEIEQIIAFVKNQLSQELEQSDVIQGMLAHIAQQMLSFNQSVRQLSTQTSLFSFVSVEAPCIQMDKAW